MAWKIADIFVQFALQGVEAVVKGVDQVKAGLEQVQKGAAVFGQIATAGLAAASATMYGFVRSGLAASNMGVLLNFQFERLSRSIAGLFGPEIRRVIDLISQLTGWIERLSSHQKDLIARFLLGAFAALTVATTLPYVLSGVTALIAGVRTLTAAVLGLEGAATGGLLPVLGAAAAAFTALAVGTEVGRGGIGRLWTALQPLLSGLQQIGSRLLDALAPVGDFLVYLLETVGRTVLAVIGPVQEAASIIGQALAGAFETLSPIVAGFAAVWSRLVEAVAAVIPKWGQMVAGIVTALTPVIAALMRFQLAIADLVADLVESVTGAAERMQPFVAAVVDLAESVGDVLGAALEAVGGLLVDIVGLLLPVIELFLEFSRLILTVVTPAIRLLAEALHEVAGWLRVIGGLSAPEIKIPKFELPKQTPNREQLPLRTGGFESIEQTYRRIAEASIKVGIAGKTPAEKTVDELQTVNRKLDTLDRSVKANKVPIQ